MSIHPFELLVPALGTAIHRLLWPRQTYLFGMRSRNKVRAQHCVSVETMPMVDFRASRLTVPANLAPNFIIEQMSIGGHDQFAFGVGADVLRHLSNLPFDGKPGHRIIVVARNVSKRWSPFFCAVSGAGPAPKWRLKAISFERRPSLRFFSVETLSIAGIEHVKFLGNLSQFDPWIPDDVFVFNSAARVRPVEFTVRNHARRALWLRGSIQLDVLA